mmetsp:Transcript_3689/g.7888  ORF Transcript_3689/g.7888 Transcript_3689/m.7888 type:complete len:211 (-) Transcript_3689:1562-2194(-)
MWNLGSGKGLYKQFNQELEDERHRERMRAMRASVDTRPPKIPQRPQSKTKRQRMVQDRNSEIQEHNRMLLKKMLSIDLKPSPLNPISITQNPAKPSLNSNFRNREMRKIADANKKIMQRLKSATSVYSCKKWENDRQYKVYLRDNISRNSGRFRRPSTTKASDHDTSDLIGSIMKRHEIRPKTASVGLDSEMTGNFRPRTQGQDLAYLDQ